MEKLELVDSVTFFSLVKKEPYGRASTVGGFGIHQFIIKPPTVVKRHIFRVLLAFYCCGLFCYSSFYFGHKNNQFLIQIWIEFTF